jgi:hypothetical protein
MRDDDDFFGDDRVRLNNLEAKAGAAPSLA